MNAKRVVETCYGNLFPDFARLKAGETLEEQALTALVVGSGTGPESRTLRVKHDAWGKYVQCPDYRACYDSSMAKLLMNNVLENTTCVSPWVGEVRRRN